MKGEPATSLSSALGIERLEDLDDPGVEGAAPLLEQARVGYLLGERVLEGVLQIREEGGLVQELGGLEATEPLPEWVLGDLENGLEERELHVLADDGGRL